MREQFGRGIQQLGVVPFYPLRESARLGQLYLVDVATVNTPGPVFVPTNVLLTNAAVPFMETYRAERQAAANRYPCSSDKLGTQILTGQTVSYYQQPDCSAPSGGDGAAKPASATPAGNEVTINLNVGSAAAKPAPAPNKPATAKPPGSLAPLELAGLPSYSLASIETFSAAGSLPTAFASFLAAIGFSHSNSLQVQAEGVEIASLSAEDFSRAILKACSAAGNPFSDPGLAHAAMAFADSEMRDNAGTRAKHALDPAIREQFIRSGGKVFPYKPMIYMLRQVYYLRGIRYIYNDSRVVTAMAAAAASAKIPTAQQPPAPPNISIVNAPQTTGSAPAAAGNSQLAAQVAALQAQVDAMRSAVSSNTNIQVGASYTQATARGIEMVDLFQRPLAFGHAPVAIEFHIERGLDDYCRAARGETVLP